MQDKKLKELFATIPSPDDIFSLGVLGHRAEFILVDAEKDKSLSILKKFSAATLVKCQYSNPSFVVKKIARIVSAPSHLPGKLSHYIVSLLRFSFEAQLLMSLICSLEELVLESLDFKLFEF